MKIYYISHTDFTWVRIWWIINMHYLTFCIISVFDIWPFRPKYELDGTSEGTETYESCFLPEAHSWLVSQLRLDTRPPDIQPGTLYPQHSHRSRQCSAQNSHRASQSSNTLRRVELCVFMRKKYMSKGWRMGPSFLK